MVSLLVRWIAMAVAVLLAAYVVPGIEVRNPQTAFLTAVVLSLLNAILRPILIFFTLPVTIVTLGLFMLVINAFMLWLTGWLLRTHGFSVHGFVPAFLGALVISIVGGFLHAVLKPKKEREQH